MAEKITQWDDGVVGVGTSNHGWQGKKAERCGGRYSDPQLPPEDTGYIKGYIKDLALCLA